MLLMDIRYEHQAVLGEKWQAWIPIGYIGLLILLEPFGIFTLRRIGRYLLVSLFGGLVFVGLLGFWFHTKGRPIQVLGHLIAVDLGVPGHLDTSAYDGEPPPIAPLSLAGFGAIGVAVSLLHPNRKKKFDEEKRRDFTT